MMLRTILVAVLAWTMASIVLVAVVLALPASVGLAIAAILILGPLAVWAFQSEK